MLSATPSARPARGGSTTSASSPPSSGSSRAASPPTTSMSTPFISALRRRSRTDDPAASMAMTSAPARASGTENVPPPAYRSATSSPSRPSGPSSPIRPPRPSTTSAASFSACAVFTWKNDGALVRKRASASSSPQQPLPSRVSTPFILRARPGSASTRTMLVALSALLSVFATCARGNAPGLVHSAISVSRVRTLCRTPTRKIPRSAEPCAKRSAPRRAFGALATASWASGQTAGVAISCVPSRWKPSRNSPFSARAAPSSSLLR